MWRWSVPQQPPKTVRRPWRRRSSAVRAPRSRGIAVVERGRGVQFGVAFGRGVGTEAGDAVDPGAAGVEHGREMRRVGAVHHVVGRRGAGGGVDGRDRLAERLAGGEPAVGLDRDRNDGRHLGIGGGAGDAGRLLGVVHGDGGDEVGAGVLEDADLGGVVALGLLDAHQPVRAGSRRRAGR